MALYRPETDGNGRIFSAWLAYLDGCLPETYVGNGWIRRTPGPRRVAAAVSVLMLLLIALWWPQLPESVVISADDPVLEMTIQLPEPKQENEDQEFVESAEAANARVGGGGWISVVH
jgi:hypothetical protein